MSATFASSESGCLFIILLSCGVLGGSALFFVLTFFHCLMMLEINVDITKKKKVSPAGNLIIQKKRRERDCSTFQDMGA